MSNERVIPDSTANQKVALVAGAHGLVGQNVSEYLSRRLDWTVLMMGRRKYSPFAQVPYAGADLTDRTAASEALRTLPRHSDVTHLFFAAYQGALTLEEEVTINTDLLSNSIAILQEAGAPLQQTIVYHGSKAYGAHLGPFRTPAKETDPRISGPLFYNDQEDLLRKIADKGGASYTIFRPDHICGIAFGHFISLINAIAMYAVISRELGEPLRFPASESAYHALVQATDAQLLARASDWSTTTEKATNQVFNVTNGDYFRWENVWPAIAGHFGMEVGPPIPRDLANYMADKGPIWEELVKTHDLHSVDYAEFANWQGADLAFGLQHDLVSSTIKLRQAGFDDCLDTEARFSAIFVEMGERGLIPR